MTPNSHSSQGNCHEKHPSEQTQAALTLAAIGIVFGDIGTSPLYTLKEVFDGSHPVTASADNVYGILSLVFWALTLIVSLKYVFFITRADNHGEGGIMALAALALRTVSSSRASWWISILGVSGAALFYADGMITPAISVLSAVEGLTIAAPSLSALVIPISLIVLIGLFLMQRYGTHRVGTLFGPVMLCWFTVLAILGIRGIMHHPDILNALNPWWGIRFFINEPLMAWLALGAVVLAITGGEALYADMGHFGRRPIQYAWLYLVFPALYLNYLGQGAFILANPASIKNPFYMLVPEFLLYPMVALSTLATIIASQAVISGAFSLTSQAIQLGYLPRTRTIHTSAQTIGQIYIPGVNWMLLGAVILLVISFQSSDALAAAYGLAVTLTMLITSILAIIIARQMWHWPWGKALLIITPFLIAEIAFLSANLTKIQTGGWLPLLIGVSVFTLLTTWKRGRMIMKQRLEASEPISVKGFLDSLSNPEPLRVEGTAVFMSTSTEGVPHTLLHNLIHNKVLHERIIFLTVQTLDIPRVRPHDRIVLEAIGKGFYRMQIHYGFMERPNIPAALELCTRQGKMAFDLMSTSFFLGRETLLPTVKKGMALWREKLFVLLFRNAGSAADYFRIPSNRVIELGTQLEI